MQRRSFLSAAVLCLAAAACRRDLDIIEDCDSSTRGGTDRGPTSLTEADFDVDGGCPMTPEDVLGPYYLCVQDFRQSIAEDRPGEPLRMGFRVVNASCEPIPDAVVDVWHCDAEGNYSGFDADPDIEAGESKVNATDTRFCRGAQTTNEQGIAEFVSIFPGWYAGRTTHVHVRVYLPDGRQLTTQTYFEESVRDDVYSKSPYDGERSATYPTNADESIEEAAKMLVRGTTDMTATIQLVT